MLRKSDAGERRALGILVIAAILLRGIGLAVFGKSGTGIFLFDTPSYVDSAKMLIREGHLIYDGFRTPGYPALIAFFLRLFGERYYAGVIAVQIICNVIAVLYVYRLTVLLSGKHRAGMIAAGIAAVNFLDIVYTYLILPDSITQSLALIALYYYAKSLMQLKARERFLPSLLIGSLLMLLAILARPSLMFLPYALIIGFAFAAVLVKRYKAIIAVVLIIAVTGILPVQLWSARNARVADFNGYSTVSEINLLHFNAAAVYAKQNGMTHYEAQALLEAEEDETLQQYMREMKKYDAYHRRAMELIKSDLPFYLKTCLKDCVYLTVYPGVMRFKVITDALSGVIDSLKASSLSFGTILGALKSANVFCLLLLGADVAALVLIAVAALIGAIRLLKKDWLTACLILGVLLYNYVVGCQPVLIGAYSRFRLSFSMVMLPFAGEAVSCIFKERKKMNGKG